MYRSAGNSWIGALSDRTHASNWLVAVLCVAALVSEKPQIAFAQNAAEEYHVKAAFLFHFAQFVDWPAGALDASDHFMTLCVFEDEPSRQEFQNTIDGKFIGSRVTRVRLISQPQDIQGCNVLFLSRNEARRQAAILKSLRNFPILTVGETENFLSDGGTIRFHLEEDKIRFDINLGAADSSHLKISSRLLLLATSVSRDVADRGR